MTLATIKPYTQAQFDAEDASANVAVTVDRIAQTACAHLSISDAGLINYANAPASAKFDLLPPHCPDCGEYLYATLNVSGLLAGSTADIVVLVEPYGLHRD